MNANAATNLLRDVRAEDSRARHVLKEIAFVLSTLTPGTALTDELGTLAALGLMEDDGPYREHFCMLGDERAALAI